MQLIIQAETAQELKDRILDLAAHFPINTTLSVAMTKEAEQEFAKAAKDAPIKEKTKAKAKAQPKIEAAPVEVEEEAPQVAAPKKADITVDDVRSTIQALLSQKNGTITAQQLLSKFKAQRLSELKPEQYAAFMAEAQNSLA